MALFVPETCPRNSKRGFFVTFNANFYLRNRKLLLRRCKLPRGRLRWRRLLGGKLPSSRLRLRRCNLPLRRWMLPHGRLRWRMTPGNVAKDTPLGLDTGGWRLIEWGYNKGEREKGNPNGHRDRLLRGTRRLLHRRPGGRPGGLRRLTRRPPLRRGPSHARRRPSEAREGPSERRRRPRLGHPTGGAPEALRGAISKPEGAPSKAGGVRGADGGPEQLRNVGVAKIPESITCEVAHTFAKSGLRSQLEQPCEQSHTQKGSRATL